MADGPNRDLGIILKQKINSRRRKENADSDKLIIIIQFLDASTLFAQYVKRRRGNVA
jgi:hypothetical protein